MIDQVEMVVVVFFGRLRLAFENKHRIKGSRPAEEAAKDMIRCKLLEPFRRTKLTLISISCQIACPNRVK